MKRKLLICLLSLIGLFGALGVTPSRGGAQCIATRYCEAAGGACFANCSDCCKGLVCNGPGSAV